MTQAPPEPRIPQPSGAPALAAELRTAIMRTSRRLRQERSTDDVTPGQYSVLAVLDRNGPCTPRELAAFEKVQPPSMTRTVAALTELGLVGRTEHPTDGRQVLVSLTEDGRVVVRETRRRRDAWLARRLAELTPAERTTLADAAALLLRVAQS
jgi:DNA-binding MarR family transcriptional regulator